MTTSWRILAPRVDLTLVTNLLGIQYISSSMKTRYHLSVSESYFPSFLGDRTVRLRGLTLCLEHIIARPTDKIGHMLGEYTYEIWLQDSSPRSNASWSQIRDFCRGLGFLLMIESAYCRGATLCWAVTRRTLKTLAASSKRGTSAFFSVAYSTMLFTSLAAAFLAASSVQAHATFQQFWVGSVDQVDKCVRKPASNSPVTSVTTNVSPSTASSQLHVY